MARNIPLLSEFLAVSGSGISTITSCQELHEMGATQKPNIITCNANNNDMGLFFQVSEALYFQ